MKEVLKKQSIGSLLSITTIIFSLIAMFLYIMNGNSNYYHDFKVTIVILSAAAILVEAIFMVMVRAKGEKQWLDIVYVVVPVLLAISAIVFISSRVESAGIILASDLEKGNKEAINALYQAFTGIAFYLLAVVICVTGSFFSQLRKE